GLLANAALPLHLPFVLALIGGALFAAVSGVIVERLAFRPLRTRGSDPLLTLVSSLGVAVALVNVIQYLFGAEAYSYPADPFGQLPSAMNFGTSTEPVLVRTVQVIIFGVSMVVLALLTVLMNATRTGKALRAVAEDTVTASLLGINTDRLILLTFVISGFLGGVSGTLIGLSVGIAGPYFGIAFGLKGLAVIVLGGLGDIPGAVVGGLLIGLAESFVPAQYIAYREAVPFALLFVVLLLRPQGLLGRAVVQKV
ncbi:MAG: flagellar biosynthesis protein FlgM, partial [Cyanobacteria bacterium 13_1_40CM_2_61_4]